MARTCLIRDRPRGCARAARGGAARGQRRHQGCRRHAGPDGAGRGLIPPGLRAAGAARTAAPAGPVSDGAHRVGQHPVGIPDRRVPSHSASRAGAPPRQLAAGRSRTQCARSGRVHSSRSVRRSDSGTFSVCRSDRARCLPDPAVRRGSVAPGQRAKRIRSAQTACHGSAAAVAGAGAVGVGSGAGPGAMPAARIAAATGWIARPPPVAPRPA